MLSNRLSSSASTQSSDRQYKAFVLSVIITGVLSFILCLGTAANAQSGSQSGSQSGRFNIQQVGDALTAYGKNTVNDNGNTYYSVVCGHDSWKSSVIVSLSPSANVIWLQLNLVEVPSHASPTALANLMKKSNDLGPVFFSIDGDWLRIASPLPNYNMSEAKLKGYLENLVNAAVDSHDLWDPKVLAAAAPAHGAATHSSMRRSVDEFDASLQRQ
jgi:hypothetical protein